MKQTIVTLVLLMTCTFTFASNLKSDEMCQEYLLGLTTDIHIAERVGIQALRVSLNRIADNHPEYLALANDVAFGTALDDAGHGRVGSHINYMCTQDGTVLTDLVYKVLLEETIRISNELEAKN